MRIAVEVRGHVLEICDGGDRPSGCQKCDVQGERLCDGDVKRFFCEDMAKALGFKCIYLREVT